MNVKNVETLRNYFCRIRKQLACYVCGKVLSKPWIVRCGHSYCKNCIQVLLYKKRTCPRCVTYPVIDFNIEKNNELYKVITQFKKMEAAFEADTNFSLSQDLFQRSHIPYQMNNREHRRSATSTTSLQAQDSSETSEILQASARTRTNKNKVKDTTFEEAIVNTTNKNAPDRKSISETEHFRRFRTINHGKDQILAIEEIRRHPSHESDLNGSGEDLADEEEEEEGEKEQNSTISGTPKHLDLESDEDFEKYEGDGQDHDSHGVDEDQGKMVQYPLDMELNTEDTKATTCKEAIQKWEEANEKPASEATEIFLGFQWPPIERMDNSLAALTNVEKLSLSTNMIEKITGISSLKKLRILSLGRNYIKTFSGLEAVGEHLEELWISYNLIEKFKGLNALKALKVLYMGNNLVKDWNEFNRLQELPNLQDLLFTNNPLSDGMDTETWRAQVTRRLPALKKLDAIPIVRGGDE